jgi:hypothetical protein
VRKIFVFLFFVCALALPAQASASITPLEAAAPNEAGEAIMADPSTQLTETSLPEYPYNEEGTASPLGVGDLLAPPPEGLTGFPTNGNTYAILSSGDVNTIGELLTNESESTTTEYESQEGNRGESAFDFSVLKLGVEVPNGDNCLSLDYRFLSEEFPEFVGSPFNDAFIAEVDSSSWGVGEGGEIARPNDFAASTAGTPISVNGVGPAAVSPAESAGTYFDAATGLITTKTPITPGPHSVYLSVFDASDHAYDSAVFLDNLHFINESPETCKPPLSAELAVPPPGAPPAPSNEFSFGPHVKFTGGGTKAIIIVVVPGPGTVGVGQPIAGASASRARASAAAQASKKRKKLIVPVSVHAAAAGPVKLTVKLTGAGKKLLAHKRKLKVPIQVTYTPDGGTAHSKGLNLTFKKHKKHKHKKH